MWSASPGPNGDGEVNIDDKLTTAEALSYGEDFNLAEHQDWRLLTIKELYSLILFSGVDTSVQNSSNLVPFIDISAFA